MEVFRVAGPSHGAKRPAGAERLYRMIVYKAACRTKVTHDKHDNLTAPVRRFV